METTDNGKLIREMEGQLRGTGFGEEAGAPLGGKSPQIVFANADLEAAAGGVVAGVFAASGQTCMAGSRLLVEDAVHDEFVSRLADRAGAIGRADDARARDRRRRGRAVRASPCTPSRS